MSKKKRSEWRNTINEYNKPLIGRERYAQLKTDYDTGMIFLKCGGEMATKELTTKVIQELLGLVSLPDEIYNVIKEKQDRIIKEYELTSYRKHYDKSKAVESTEKEGYVYFLKEYCGNTVKIGHAKDPLKRIKQMNFVPSTPVELIHTIRSRDRYRLEQMFHNYFYKKQIQDGYTTEFFDLTEEDMDDIYGRKLPKEMLDLIIDEEYELPPRLKMLERRSQFKITDESFS